MTGVDLAETDYREVYQCRSQPRQARPLVNYILLHLLGDLQPAPLCSQADKRSAPRKLILYPYI